MEFNVAYIGGGCSQTGFSSGITKSWCAWLLQSDSQDQVLGLTYTDHRPLLSMVLGGLYPRLAFWLFSAELTQLNRFPILHRFPCLPTTRSPILSHVCNHLPYSFHCLILWTHRFMSLFLALLLLPLGAPSAVLCRQRKRWGAGFSAALIGYAQRAGWAQNTWEHMLQQCQKESAPCTVKAHIEDLLHDQRLVP